MNKLIQVLKYIIIGIIQGITEILPISSSAHLSFTYKLLCIDKQQQLNLTIFLHFASSIALCFYFKDIIIKMVKDFFIFMIKKNPKNKEGFMLTIYLLIATIPSIIIGIFIKPLVENHFDNLFIICINLLITSLILLLSDKINNNTNTIYSLKNTFITGIFQCFALFPGISRSGITLFGSKLAKLDNNKGKQFTFLLLLPIAIGSTILSIFDINKDTINSSQIYLYIISFIIALLFTYFSLKLFFHKSIKIKNYYYSIYLLIISIIIIVIYY